MRNDDFESLTPWGCAGVAALWLLMVCLFVYMGVSLTSCSPRTVYVPTTEVRTEYREADTAAIYDRARSFFEAMFRRDVSSDSVIDRSKETVILKENGDTARHDKERTVYVSSRREKELERKVRQSDSTIAALRLRLESVKADSVPVPYPVERPLSKWERTKMDLGGFALGGIAVVVLAVIVWIVKIKRRK